MEACARAPEARVCRVFGVLALSAALWAPYQSGVAATVLVNAQPATVSLAAGEWAYYEISSSADDTQLLVRLGELSATGLSVYVRAGALPDAVAFDCRSREQGLSSERCLLDNGAATLWYVGVQASTSIPAPVSGTLRATLIQPGVPAPGIATLGTLVTEPLELLQHEWAYYQIPASALDDQLLVRMTQVAGDLDLYLAADRLPDSFSVDDFDCTSHFSPPTLET